MRRAPGIACWWTFALVLGASAPAIARDAVGPPEEATSFAAPSFVTPASTTAPEWPPRTSAPTPRIPRPVRPHDPGGTWFYSGLPYGSEALVHPLRLVFNGGLGALTFDQRSNRLADVDFAHGWSRLWGDMRSPLTTIRETGWNHFLEAEIIPFSINRKSGQYWPNYTLHLIGGGMSSVMMREWFEQNGWHHPALASGATMGAYNVLNEMVEASTRKELSTDAVADLLVFDPLGVWMFSHEGVDGFFSRRMHLRDWSTQPAIDPATGSVENHGQNFSMKVGFPRSDHWSLFYYFGNHGELGLSCKVSDEYSVSAGAGIRASQLVDLGNGAQTVDLIPSAGVFCDRNGSLLFSVTTATASRYGVRVNLYPGVLHVAGVSPGLFVLASRDGGTILGIHFVQFPVGLAGRRY